MTPFTVTFTLTTPMVIPTAPIHLDALLSFARVQQAEEQGSEDPWQQQHDLPLERHETSAGWCFKASWIELQAESDEQPDQLHIVRRSNVTEYARTWESGVLGKKVPAYDPARGLTKGASLIHHQRRYSTGIAYGVGDIAGVSDLLGRIRSLGKLRRRAAGWIAHFDIREGFPENNANAWQQRNLPAGERAEGYAIDLGALRAPYWKRENYTQVMTPCR